VQESTDGQHAPRVCVAPQAVRLFCQPSGPTAVAAPHSQGRLRQKPAPLSFQSEQQQQVGPAAPALLAAGILCPTYRTAHGFPHGFSGVS